MRVKSLKKTLENSDIDAYLVTDTKNVYYFTGFRDISEATLNLLITPEDESILLVSQLSLSAANKNAKNCSVRGVYFGEKIINKLIDLIKKLGAKTIHFDNLSSKTYIEITERLDTNFVPNPELVMDLRRVKDETELAHIRKACKLATIGIQAGIEAIKPGVKEYEIAAVMEYAMRAMGSEGASFETIVASGPRSAYPHGLANNRMIKKGDLVTIDLGATYAGYCSDITRTVVASEPSPKQSRILNLVFRAQGEAFQKFCAGAKAKDVDASARNVLTDGGYGKYFIHGLGHGVGLSVHESPVLSPSSEDILEEGNVVTNEPGVYIEGFGGVRIEDMVLIRKNRVERLTVAPYYL